MFSAFVIGIALSTAINAFVFTHLPRDYCSTRDFGSPLPLVTEICGNTSNPLEGFFYSQKGTIKLFNSRERTETPASAEPQCIDAIEDYELCYQTGTELYKMPCVDENCICVNTTQIPCTRLKWEGTLTAAIHTSAEPNLLHILKHELREESISLLALETPTVLCRHNESGIFCSYTSYAGLVMLVDRDTWSLFKQCNLTTCNIYYPVDAKAISAYVHVTLTDLTLVIYTDTWWEPGKEYCDLLTEFICCDRHKLWCKVAYSSWWWVILVVALCLLFFWLCPASLAFLAALLWLFVYPLRGARWCLQKAPKCCRRNKTTYGRVMTNMLLLGVVGACDSGQILTTELNVCQQLSPTTRICNVTFTAEVTLTTMNSVACVTLQDTQGKFLADLTVKYINLTDVINLYTTYYTSDWVGFSESSHRCYKAGHCKDDACSSLQTTDVDAYGELDNEIILSWPGKTICEAGCSCSACGCFYCKPSCIFSRYALIPNRTTIQSVNAPGSIYPTPYIEVNLTDIHEEVTSVIVGTTDQVLIEPFLVQIVGVYSSPQTLFASNNIIVDLNTGQARYAPAAAPGSPIALSIGDIQASSASFAAAPNINAFIYPSSSVTHHISGKTAIYNFPSPGLKTLGMYPVLPTFVPPYELYFNGGQLIAKSLTPGSLTVSITTTTSIELVQVVNRVCPNVKLVNVTGCYSCSVGARAAIEANSECLSGVVFISEDAAYITLATISLHLTEAAIVSYIHFYTTQKANNFNLCFAADTQACVQVEFTAFQSIILPTDNGTTTQNETHNKPKTKFLFDKWLDLPHWVDLTLDILLGLVVFAFLVLLLFLVYKALLLCTKKYKKL